MDRWEPVSGVLMVIGMFVLALSIYTLTDNVYTIGPVRTDVERQTLSPWFEPVGSPVDLPRGSYEVWLMDDPNWPEDPDDIEVSLLSGDKRLVGDVPEDREFRDMIGGDRAFLAASFLYVPAGEWEIVLELGTEPINGSEELAFELDTPNFWAKGGFWVGILTTVVGIAVAVTRWWQARKDGVKHPR